jgi:predicted Rossmann fold nucleotide-binding protein DprA/Smf involved in DNA uptake
MEALLSRSLDPDEHSAILLCTTLGMGGGSIRVDATPLKLLEWNKLTQKIVESPLGSPGAMLGLSAAEIASTLALTLGEAERITRLLDRGTAATLELERLREWGIWVITRFSERFPSRMKRKLRDSAPCILFGSGNLTLCEPRAVAIVGSRDVDTDGERFADCVGSWAARSGLSVVSGAARGVDKVAMNSALAADGVAIGIVSDSLQKTVRIPKVRSAIASNKLLLLTPFHPATPFSVATAMGRNKIVYSMADWAIVVSSSHNQGGTWAGAVEALRHEWTPVYVRDGLSVPDGNRPLIERGALPFPAEFGTPDGNLVDWLQSDQPSSEEFRNGRTSHRRVVGEESLIDSRASHFPGASAPTSDLMSPISEAPRKMFGESKLPVDSSDRKSLANRPARPAAVEKYPPIRELPTKPGLAKARRPVERARPTLEGSEEQWTQMATFFSTSRSIQEIVERFARPKTRVKSWLEPYVVQERLQRIDRPTVTYRLSPERLIN